LQNYKSFFPPVFLDYDMPFGPAPSMLSCGS